MTDRIFLQRMAFFGRHGVTDEERSDVQQIDVDLEVRLDLRTAGHSDELTQTVDYGRLHELCRRVVEDESFRLLEAIAERIARTVLEDQSPIESVVVTVSKPGVPIDGQLDSAGVTIERAR